MYGKTPVTALQEYCAKNSVPNPNYKFSKSTESSSLGGFHCMVDVLDEIAEGIGRSKKEAKHDAAAKVIERLKMTHTDIVKIPQIPHETIPTSDAVADLRDICLNSNHPFPTFEVVQQSGPPEAPEFIVECRVSSIIRYGTHSTKKGARQLAAQQIINIIQAVPVESHKMNVVKLDDLKHNEKFDKQNKIKSYREFIESDIKVLPGIKLSDRHNFFKNFDKTVKDAAFIVLKQTYPSEQLKFEELLKCLNLQYKVSIIHGNELFIELVTGIDVAFFGSKDTIYGRIFDYFNNMIE